MKPAPPPSLFSTVSHVSTSPRDCRFSRSDPGRLPCQRGTGRIHASSGEGLRGGQRDCAVGNSRRPGLCGSRDQMRCKAVAGASAPDRQERKPPRLDRARPGNDLKAVAPPRASAAGLLLVQPVSRRRRLCSSAGWWSNWMAPIDPRMWSRPGGSTSGAKGWQPFPSTA